MRVQHVDGEYRVVLTAEAMAALHLTDGAEVEIRSLAAPTAEPVATTGESRYVSFEEGINAFLRTEPLHRNTYRALAE